LRLTKAAPYDPATDEAMAAQPLGSEARPLRVAVVGSGPSAFYAAQALFKAAGTHALIDMFDRMPTPFGLVRGGVAPDHQKIKSVVRIYEEIAADPRFRFFGNVKIGRDLHVADLVDHYDQVVYAVGNESDRAMDIPGEDLAGVHSATEFVGWYNAHPDYRDRRFDLANARAVAVVGNGNVAMDVTRILMKDPAALRDTDVADRALRELDRSSVREVLLLGRRGPAQAAFSPKELEEIAELAGCSTVVDPAQVRLDPVSEAWLPQAPRSAQRNVKLLQELAERGEGEGPRRVRCMFLVSPVEVLGKDGRVCGLRLQHSELVRDADGTPRPRGLDRFSTVEVQLVFKAIGYRGVAVPGVPFDERRGVIPNADGRVTETTGGPVVPMQYVVGWAKRGPTGLIGTNSPDSQDTVRRMLEDVVGRSAAPLPGADRDRVPALLAARGVDAVTFADWRRLDAWELEQGKAKGRCRHKCDDVAEMMAVIRELRAKDCAGERTR
jgi:ferredoxin--NADP+ reductase